MAELLAQDCEAFLPMEVNKAYKYNMYDKKDRFAGSMEQKLISMETRGDTTYFNIYQSITDKKGKDSFDGAYTFKCTNNVFIMDMRTMINQQQPEAYKDMEVRVSGTDLTFPKNLEPGMELENGEINIEVDAGMMTMRFGHRSFNRKVVALENIETPAGTYEAYKLSSENEGKAGPVNTYTKSITWYVEDVGMVRSENYDKKGNMDGYMELVSVQ